MKRQVVEFLWLRYHKYLWCAKCYVWNPLLALIERGGNWFFDNADLVVRKKVTRILHDPKH